MENKFVQLIAECRNCVKCKDIANKEIDGCPCTVFSNRVFSANIMVVGQNPGKVEVLKGTPFRGKSGAFFDKAIKEVLKISRKDLYITNVIKCYTPGNRPPTGEEVLNCRNILLREIQYVKPNLLIALGNFALQALAGRKGITQVAGEIILSYYGIPLLPLLHPSPLNMNKQKNAKEFYKHLEKVEEYL